jgi:DNA invertase Pin-like site-specific DNA recombinase
VKIAYEYLRKSTLDKKGIFEQHRKDLSALASRLDAEIPEDGVYIDDDTSASEKRGKKTAWAKCLADIRAKRPDFLLGWKHDRLGRRLGDLEGLDELASEVGIRVWTHTDGDLFANPAWPFLAAQAKTETRNTSIRVKAAQELRRSKGLQSGGGSRPFGYAADRATVISKEKAWFRELVMRLTDGEPRNALARDFNVRGIRTAGGTLWTAGRIVMVVSNPRYAGFLVHKGEVIGKGTWPSLITPEEFELVKSALAATAPKKVGRPVTTLLAHILRCGICLTPMVGSTSKGRKRYKCPFPECKRVSRSREPIDALVTLRIQEKLNSEVIAVELEKIARIVDDLAQVDVELDLRIFELRQKYTNGALSGEDFYPMLDDLRQQQKQTQASYTGALTEQAQLARESTARERWDSWTTDQKRLFIKARVTAIEVFHPEAPGVACDQDVKIIWRRRLTE